ncbi:MAG: LCP family protein [Eubacterium sp.]|nr:LCP family protein [Eubacterium sp.]
MDYNDKNFGKNGRNRDDRDRTVPPEENYYGTNGYDFVFNKRTPGRDVYNENDYDNYDPETYNGDFDDADHYDSFASDTDYSFNDVFSGRNSERNYNPDQPRRSRPAPKKKKKKNKFSPIIALLSILLALVMLISVAGFSILGKIGYDEKIPNSYVNTSELYASAEVKNILLIGVDARADESGNTSRSDTMLLISVDSVNNCIKMTSFLRDSWVYIPCIDRSSKLNASCKFGGYSAVVDTIEYNFGIDIDGYVVTDFELFTVMVDSIGGVEIEVTEAEANEVTKHKGTYGGVVLEAGKNKLTGEQALAYCRIRKIGTDWGRTQRQRTVMEAIIKKALRAGPITAFTTLANAAPYIETDLTKSELMALGFKAIGCISGGFKQASCPFEGTWNYARRSGADVIVLNVDKNKEELKNFIYGE